MQLESHNLWSDHENRLPEHARLGLDSADAPSQNSQAVDHRCVRIGADQRIRKSDSVADLHDFRQKLQIHLMHDAGGGRDDVEVAKRLLPPLKELIPLAIALKFFPGVVDKR